MLSKAKQALAVIILGTFVYSFSPAVESNELTGLWKGGFTCSSGSVGANITFSPSDRGDTSKGRLDFYQQQGGAPMPSGAISLNVSLYKNGNFKIRQNRWLDRPDGWKRKSSRPIGWKDKFEFTGSFDGRSGTLAGSLRSENCSEALFKSEPMTSWKAVQTRLQSLGYKVSVLDGDPGAETQEAITTFRYENDLTQSGVLTRETEQLLFSAMAKRLGHRELAKKEKKEQERIKKQAQSTQLAQSNVKPEVSQETTKLSVINQSTTDLPKPDSQITTNNSPLSKDNLAGRWIPTKLFVGRRSGKPFFRRRSLGMSYDIVNSGTDKYEAYKVPSGRNEATESVEIIAKQRHRFLTLQLPSNQTNLRDWFPSLALRQQQSRHGVDILTDVSGHRSSNSLYLIRFRDSQEFRNAKIGLLDYSEFCAGPAERLAELIYRESRALESIRKVSPSIASKYRQTTVLSMAAFGSEIFEDVTGSTFSDLSSAGKSTLFERLRVCAIYHPDRHVGGMIAKALIGDRFTVQTVGLEVGRSIRPKKPLHITVTPAGIEKALQQAKTNRLEFSAELEKLNNSKLAGGNLLKSKWEVYSKYAFKMLPSEHAPELVKIAKAIEEIDLRAAIEREAMLDRTAPAKPQHVLLLDATSDFIVKDCNRAALALRAARNEDGESLVPIVIARSVKAKNDVCVIDSATHLLSFNIAKVENPSCETGDPTNCKFTAYWYCKYELNPDFGWDKKTANIDIVCPLVRSQPIQMNGQYERKAPRRWIANRVDW